VNEQQREFTNLPVDCNGCHRTDFNNSTNPVHPLAGFSLECLNCHSPSAYNWQNVNYLHTAAFTLLGGHANVGCITCHETTYKGTTTDCYQCHKQEYKEAIDPPHELFGFPTTCENCHTVFTWERSTFNHIQESGFELVGAHQSALCLSCHVNNQLTGLPRDCIGCHEVDYNSATDPDHAANQLSTDCSVCHNQNAWEPATFDHATTAFPLTGAHVSLNCIECHSEGYQNTPIDCWSCHESDYTEVEDPNHVQNNFDQNCLLCHTTNAWEPATFDHASTTFPLTGAHVSLNCIECHSAGYQNTPIDCWSCHESDYTEVEDPNHVQNDFDHNCLLCHSTNAWEPATFDHASTTFPLTGAHVSLNCIECHSEGYQNTPTDCWSCHESDYTEVEDPNHVQNDFDHNCLLCHNTINWDVTSFDHSLTNFQLSGAHVGLGCEACHSSGFTNTLIECIACHQQDYDNTSNPDHSAAQFPHSCEDCHTSAAWSPANWDHDNQYFPIYSGSHREEWNSCADCHVDPNDYGRFECINCHKHRQSEMDEKHKEENDYEYNSEACYFCHPTGKH